MELSFPVLAAIQVVFILAAFRWYFRRNDEIPLLISGCLLYVASFRYWAVTAGLSAWVDISSIGVDRIGDESALEALGLLVLGEAVLLVAYMYAQKRTILVLSLELPPSVKKTLLPAIISAAIAAVLFVILLRPLIRHEISSGKSIAFQISNYLTHAPMLLVGMGCLLILLWKFGAFRSRFYQCAFWVLIIGLVGLTYGPIGRFVLFGWLLAGTIILSAGCSWKKRLRIFSMGVGVAGAMFALAGAARDKHESASELRGAAWKRALAGVDANMLDGFALLREVYPRRLNYSYGMEHVEILLRPIPRVLWPGKPVGGYTNKLGLITAESGYTVGISPSLLGSFYQEGGVTALILLALLYGWGIARLVMWSTMLHPFAGILIRGVLCAGLIPLLRGGDLPGIYAWFGMSFWPCFLLLWIYRRELICQRISRISTNRQNAPVPPTMGNSRRLATLRPWKRWQRVGLKQRHSKEWRLRKTSYGRQPG